MRRAISPALMLLAVAVAGAAGCAGGGGIGAPCAGNGDCDGPEQCLNEVCVGPCERAPDCGDGFACNDGACVTAHHVRGDPCESEVECIAGLTCQINGAETDMENRLLASCESENSVGSATGKPCVADDDCRNGACDLGHCVDLCQSTSDCPAGTSCMTIPRVAVGGLLYSGCLPASGIITWQIPVISPSAQILLPVPSEATAAELVMSVDDPGQKVGAAAVLDPCGCRRYTVPCDFPGGSSAQPCTPVVASDQYFSLDPGGDTSTGAGNAGNDSAGNNCNPNRLCDDDGPPRMPPINRIRHRPALGRSVLLMPTIPRPGELKLGAYQVQVSSFWPDNANGSAIPHVTAVVRIGAGAALDLHFFFLDLSDHPCAAKTGDLTLNAASASSQPFFLDDFVGTVRGVFSHAGVGVNATYEDIPNHHALDGVDLADLGALFALGHHASGINVFFVRSLSPVGVEVFSPNPGPAGIAGTPESGIVVSLDTLCYRDWPALGRLTAHALARYMGLYHNIEPRDPSQAPGAPRWEDLVPDSDDDPGNLMYFSARDGTALSIGQLTALTRSPVLQ